MWNEPNMVVTQSIGNQNVVVTHTYIDTSYITSTLMVIPGYIELECPE